MIFGFRRTLGLRQREGSGVVRKERPLPVTSLYNTLLWAAFWKVRRGSYSQY